MRTQHPLATFSSLCQSLSSSSQIERCPLVTASFLLLLFHSLFGPIVVHDVNQNGFGSCSFGCTKRILLRSRPPNKGLNFFISRGISLSPLRHVQLPQLYDSFHVLCACVVFLCFVVRQEKVMVVVVWYV